MRPAALLRPAARPRAARALAPLPSPRLHAARRLYDNLQKYDLPHPTAVFEIDFFRRNPDPFYLLARELYPGAHRPTPAHFFIRLLHEKGLLRRCFTQNIDSLETLAGLPRERVVAAHGNFDTASVVTGEARGQPVPPEKVREAVMGEGGGGWRALKEEYGGLVKPDIVFFGEDLPPRFFRLSLQDMQECDLLLVMGTSLAVHPFAGIMHLVGEDVPRLLLNREKVADCEPELVRAYLEAGKAPKGFVFDGEHRRRDVFHPGDCDNSVRELCQLLGWEEDLDALIAADRDGVRAGAGAGAVAEPGGAPGPSREAPCSSSSSEGED